MGTLTVGTNLRGRPNWAIGEWIPGAPGTTPTAFNPAAEIIKDGDDAVVRLEIPGIDVENDVTVELDRGRLVISGERRDPLADDDGSRTLKEVRYGSFKRSFAVPAHVTAEAISASYEAGLLIVRVAGAHAGSTAQRIAITR